MVTTRLSLNINRDVLQRIADTYHLGRIETVAPAPRGMNNPVYIVNDRYVMRFDGLQLNERSRFHGEVLAYQCLRQNNIPAPEVIALDLSKTIAPVDYLVMSKVNGVSVIDSWSSLSAAQQRQVAWEAGSYLAHMHAMTFTGFGHLKELPENRFPSWYGYLADLLDWLGHDGITTGVLTSSDYDRLLAVFAAHKPLFDQVTVPHLVHWDYHFENILQQDGHISGILDFEWALCGDPTLDLRQERQWEETCPGSRDFVYAGYTAHRALAPDHALRVKLYTMLQNLDWAVDQGFAGDTQIEGKAQLLAALASF